MDNEADRIIAAGKKLDAHHGLKTNGMSATCTVCRFLTDGTDSGHMPTPEEVPKVDRWIADHRS